jgi:hypothetical protein
MSTKLVKLIAKVNVKHGSFGETAAPGQAFEVDEATAAVLVENRSAASPEDYEREQALDPDGAKRISELEEENRRLRAAAR